MTGASANSLDQGGRFPQGLPAIHFGRLPVFGTSVADLDRRRLVDYFVRLRDQDMLDAAKNGAMRVSQPEGSRSYDAAWESLLLNTGVLERRFSASAHELPATTVASLLLFGKNPGKRLPQARVEATAYIGKSKDGRIREHDTLRGPIVALHDQDGAIREPGLVGQTMAFIRRLTSTEGLGTGKQYAAWDYAPQALCEAMFNAVVHRDYRSAGAVEIDLYADRIEVTSPGPLPDGMTVVKMRAGTRHSRNEFLGNVVRDYRRPKKRRLGVPRLIIDGMKRHNGTEADLIAEDARFTVRLWNRTPNTAHDSAAALRHLANMETDHWREDAAAARLVAGAVENDHV